MVLCCFTGKEREAREQTAPCALRMPCTAKCALMVGNPHIVFSPFVSKAKNHSHVDSKRYHFMFLTGGLYMLKVRALTCKFALILL